MNKAPFTFRAIKTSVKNNQTIDSNVTGLVTSPNATNVSGFSTTIPEDLNPKKAINKPIPAVIPTLSGAGIAAINNSLKDVKVSNKKRSEEHTSELQSRFDIVCRLLLEKKKKKKYRTNINT